MKEFPLVSVIIPCFNSGEWMGETLSSVFDQTYPNIEVIVIDDGSTDNTKEIVLNYSDEILYYYQKNKGPSAARNLGAKKARGKYIAFLDSDDVWEDNKLSLQVGYLEKNKNVQLVFSNVNLINEKGEHLYSHFNRVPIGKKEIIMKFFLGEITMNTPTIVVKRDSLLNVGGFDEELPLREDHFFLMMMTHKYEIFHFKELLVNRRVSTKSMSNSLNVEKIFKMNEPFILKSVKKFPFLSNYKKNVYSRVYSAIARGYWKKRNYLKALLYIIKSIYNKPLKLRNYIFFFLILLRVNYKYMESAKWKLKKNNKIISRVISY
ncbi:glycosyltransferase [Oceanobacillus massiliensis]|uniref:glycosyltransferase n=1 Tax=Oceanobacillus massiliensis TaxID=1465765 RepID=UPI0002891A61|nr:glycosyltransferase [Oceanobacillus massiliensis]